MRISDWSSDVCSSDLCKSDCPVNVDMATYKAEFMSHHYRGRLRPRAAYAMGLIWWLSRIASHMTRFTNIVDRKSVEEGKRVSVRVDLGGGRMIKKKSQVKTQKE